MDEGDLSGLLPEPPPPRPAARNAAIAAAMRRFDGIADVPAAAERPRTSPWSARWGAVGAFASILLVMLIGIPITLRTLPQQSAGSDPRAGAAAIERPASAGPQRSAEPPATAPQAACGTVDCTRDIATSPRTSRPSGAIPAEDIATSAPAEEARAQQGGTAQPEALASRFERAPPPAAPPAPAVPPSGQAARPGAPSAQPSIVVTGQLVRQPSMEPAAPVNVAGKAAMADEGNDIVVSGARSASPRAVSRRGDWNACTVDDPEQNLRSCRRLVNPAAKGSAGAAAAHVADGLALGWRRDWERAIGAFDQAIALDPDMAFAYLNRGLAYQHKGDLARAAADLDQAVRHAPRAARGYYHRSIIRRLRGDARGAEADAERAGDLDPRYDAVPD